MSQDLTLGMHVIGGECTSESDGAWGGDQLFEVLKHWDLHLVFTQVVPVGGGADKREKKTSCAIQYLSGVLSSVRSSKLLVCL